MWKDSVDKKKKSGHPPMEDSRKLENFDYLEYSERVTDYEGNMGYSNEVYPNEVVCIDFGNGETMTLPANNYDVKIKLEDSGFEKTLTIRAENLATGDCKIVTRSYCSHMSQMGQGFPS